MTIPSDEQLIEWFGDAGPKGRIKYLLQGIAIHSELANDCTHDLRKAESEDQQDKYDLEAAKHFAYRNGNMREVWRILDEELTEAQHE